MKSIDRETMLNGDELKTIVSFMLPMLVGGVFQQLYTMVDSVVVGRLCGTNSLAAVGSIAGIHSLFLAFCIGVSGGVNVFCARVNGEGDKERLRIVEGNAIVLTLVVGIVMSLVSLFFARPILVAMNVPKESFADALIYMQIVCGTMLITAMYNTVSSVVYAMGDSRLPLYFVILGAVVNVLLDLVLVGLFRIGVGGAAIATAISSFVIFFVRWLYARDLLDNSIYFRISSSWGILIVNAVLEVLGLNYIFHIACLLMIGAINFGEISKIARRVFKRWQR